MYNDGRWTLRWMLALALLAAVVLLWLNPYRADAALIREADQRVSVLRVTNMDRVGARRIKVTLNNGSVWMTRPCRVDPGSPRDCYQRRVNKYKSAPYVRLDTARIIRVNRLP